jgi:hypothetical protein
LLPVSSLVSPVAVISARVSVMANAGSAAKHGLLSKARHKHSALGWGFFIFTAAIIALALEIHYS